MLVAKVKTKTNGELLVYDAKNIPGGKLLWCTCADGVTKMPLPVFVRDTEISEIVEILEAEDE